MKSPTKCAQDQDGPASFLAIISERQLLIQTPACEAQLVFEDLTVTAQACLALAVNVWSKECRLFCIRVPFKKFTAQAQWIHST